jgi:hypothetical protein
LFQQDAHAGEDLIQLMSDGDNGPSSNSSALAGQQEAISRHDLIELMSNGDGGPSPKSPKVVEQEKTISGHDLTELMGNGDDGPGLNSPEVAEQEEAIYGQDPSNECEVRVPPEGQPNADINIASSTAALATPCTPSPNAKAARKKARVELKAAWFEREACRKRLISKNHWPKEDYEKFETATNEYNTRRDKLAGLMASGQLTQDDSRVYPKLSAKTTTAPKVRPNK